MQRSNRSLILVSLVGAAAATVLTGCSSGGTSTPTATETVTATPAPTTSSSGSAASSPADPSSSASSVAGGTGTGGSAGGPARCAADDLTGSIEPGSGGAAGSQIVHLALRNTGATTCTLQGWPGVSFVGGGDGAQIGAAARQEKSAPHPTVTLRAGDTAVAPLQIVTASNFAAADCGPKAADGFRVYPPGSKASLFVRDTGLTACSVSSAQVLSVQALVPEGQATE
ncbi:Protein of unknown function [Curtobacterium sp. UNCCL20]|uniref:DUF4232 domain-containing protein n=1 Tax=Curtobacterium sp. UNCCL20 TaxID=1502773 RepID=UPI000889B878|nr:DUF4232 domain-containing protein [Curtobacterium sp. UNCCL20]SDQ18118.1 Protein of unknown function [Curtobacterium sp. UNCCL20]